MRTKYIIITLLALVIYYIAAYYVGWRLLYTLHPYLNGTARTLFWVVYITLCLIYILGRLGQFFLPGHFCVWLIRAGAYWLGLWFYLLLSWITYDTALIAVRYFANISSSEIALSADAGILLFLISSGIFIYGIWNAHRLKIIEYQIRVDKPCHKQDLRIVAASDLHLGLLVGKDRMQTLVEQINRLKPDLVLLPGDILDENIGTFLDEEMYKEFNHICAPLGKYACLGSHEYILGHAEKAISAMHLAGITVLRDEAVNIANSFYIVGRDDMFRVRLTDIPRASLKEILKDCNRQLPIILLDHNPSALDEAWECGVDLQLSGHTHGGQFFPITLITKFMFKLNHGYLQRGGFYAIVSSGYGVWLLPLRIGTTPELLKITVLFTKQ